MRTLTNPNPKANPTNSHTESQPNKLPHRKPTQQTPTATLDFLMMKKTHDDGKNLCKQHNVDLNQKPLLNDVSYLELPLHQACAASDIKKSQTMNKGTVENVD